MTTLLRRVKTRLYIHVHRKVRGMLEGDYLSIFHGRSLEFDDLRDYVPGDEIKDIDWKATARQGKPLIKRFVADRKQTIIFVVDTGRNMAALATEGEVKRDVAILATGVLSYIAARHGDLVSLVAGDETATEVRRPESTDAHLERMLQLIQSRTTLDAPKSDLRRQLDYVARAFRRRSVVVVIADDRELGEDERRLLRRLAVQHEMLWITVGDADLMRATWSKTAMHNVADQVALPEYLRSDRALRADFEQQVLTRERLSAEFLDRLGISNQRVIGEADVIPGIFRLLEVHRHSRR